MSKYGHWKIPSKRLLGPSLLPKWSEHDRKPAKVIHHKTQMFFTGYSNPNTLNKELWLLFDSEYFNLGDSQRILDLLLK